MGTTAPHNLVRYVVTTSAPHDYFLDGQQSHFGLHYPLATGQPGFMAGPATMIQRGTLKRCDALQEALRSLQDAVHPELCNLSVNIRQRTCFPYWVKTVYKEGHEKYVGRYLCAKNMGPNRTKTTGTGYKSEWEALRTAVGLSLQAVIDNTELEDDCFMVLTGTMRLSPCPHCKSMNVGNRKATVEGVVKTHTHVYCEDCGMLGPSPDPSGSKWNDIPR